MKQYVLDDIAPAHAPGAAAAPVARARRWRLIAALAVIEPLVLAGFYVAMAGGSNPGVAAEGTAPRGSDAQAAPRWTAAPPPAVAAETAKALAAGTDGSPPSPMSLGATAGAPPAGADAGAPPAGEDAGAATAAKTHRIAHHGGKWIVELHGADVRSTLALLSATTRATVTGTDVIVGNPTLIHRELVASSATDAWKAVFGDLANFAITCAAPGCAVHFASAVAPSPAAATAGPALTAALTQPSFAPATADQPAPRPAVAAREASQATTDPGEPVAEN